VETAAGKRDAPYARAVEQPAVHDSPKNDDNAGPD
jgi:hypothetical protein